MQDNFWNGFEKKAFLGALGAKAVGYGAKALKSVGGAVARNPMKSIGAGLTALELGSGAKAGAQMAAKGKNLGSFNVAQGATF